MLPDGTKFFLEGDGIGKICHLLELVQTHDKADVLLLSNLRWQLQDVRFGIVLRFPFERERKVVRRVWTERELGRQVSEEGPGQLHPFVEFR